MELENISLAKGNSSLRYLISQSSPISSQRHLDVVFAITNLEESTPSATTRETGCGAGLISFQTMLLLVMFCFIWSYAWSFATNFKCFDGNMSHVPCVSPHGHCVGPIHLDGHGLHDVPFGGHRLTGHICAKLWYCYMQPHCSIESVRRAAIHLYNFQKQ